MEMKIIASKRKILSRLVGKGFIDEELVKWWRLKRIILWKRKEGTRGIDIKSQKRKGILT
jgi:hypothetical protein